MGVIPLCSDSFLPCCVERRKFETTLLVGLFVGDNVWIAADVPGRADADLVLLCRTLSVRGREGLRVSEPDERTDIEALFDLP